MLNGLQRQSIGFIDTRFVHKAWLDPRLTQMQLLQFLAEWGAAATSIFTASTFRPSSPSCYGFFLSLSMSVHCSVLSALLAHTQSQVFTQSSLTLRANIECCSYSEAFCGCAAFPGMKHRSCAIQSSFKDVALDSHRYASFSWLMLYQEKEVTCIACEAMVLVRPHDPLVNRTLFWQSCALGITSLG